MIASLALLTGLLTAADSTPVVRVVPAGDSVIVFVVTPPPQPGGFLVYRAAAGGTFVRLTPAPVTAARSGADMAGVLGPDLAPVARAVRAVDPEGVYRRLLADPFAAGVLSGLYRSVARALGRIYVDTTATRGARYEYRVVFTDGTGRETARAVTVAVRVADIRPAAPRGLSAQPGDHEVTLTWTYPKESADSIANTVAFLVYRADGPAAPFRRITPLPLLRNDASPPRFSDPDAGDGGAYRYEVTAVDLVQRESAPSAPASATPVDRVPPAAVTGLAVQTVEGAVTLVWRLAPEADAAGYLVERAPRLAGPFARLTPQPIPADRPSFVDSAALGETPVFYRVIVLDRSGNASPPSTAVRALPVHRTPPTPPSGVTATARNRRLFIRWSRSRARDVAGYNVYRTEAGGERVPNKLVSTPIRDTALVDSGFGGHGLRPGGRYVVTVTAVDSSQNESPRDSVVVTVPDDEPPGPPTGLTARDVGGRYVDVAWSGSPAPDVARYELTRTGGGDSVARVLARPGGPPPYDVRDTGTVRGRAYVYRVVAVDSAGNRSVPAVDTLSFTRPTPPPPPRHAAAARARTAGVLVEWEPVADPELAGYRIYRAPLPTGTPALVGTVLSGITSFTDTPGDPRAYYTVRAVDRSGNESAPSPPARAAGP